MKVMSEAREVVIRLDPDLAVKSYFRDPDWVFKSALGGIFNAVSLAVILCIPVLMPIALLLVALNFGFVLRAVRQKVKEPESLIPSWDNWTDLFVSGVGWLVVLITFILLGTILVAANLLIATALSAAKTYSELFVIWLSASSVIFTILGLSLNLVLSLSMINFASEEKLGSAFALVKVLRRIFKHPRQFLYAWLIGTGIQWLAVLLPLATIIGVLFLPTTVFAAQVIAATIMAQSWADCQSETA
jgi:hypothetical protein